MGSQIIKQPNGLYAVFSSIVDNFTMVDATIEDIIDDRVEDYRERVTKDVNLNIEILEKGGKPYFQRTMTLNEALEVIAERHGKVEFNRKRKAVGG